MSFQSLGSEFFNFSLASFQFLASEVFNAKWGWQAYRTATIRGICTFAVFFSVSRPFCCFTLVYEGHFILCYKEKIELLDRVIANFERSAWFLLLSACRFVEFDTSIICHVYCFGSFLLQDIFLSLQEFVFEGQNMTFTVNVLLTCIIYCDTGPGYD